MSLFKKAKRSQAKLRLGLIGPSGSGKTMSGVRIAAGLANGGKIALIDTEHSSGSIYSDVVEFDACNLDSFEVENYIAAIEEAGREGYAVVIIDSLSHAWAGKGGILEFVDKAGKRGGNNYTAWRDATPRHNQLIEAILGCPCHVICTLRSKVEHVIEKDGSGRTTVRKVGLQPVQREGMEYEFTVCGDITDQHELIITKTRAAWLKDEIIREPGEEFGRRLLAWLDEGEPVKHEPAQQESSKLVLQTIERIATTKSAEALERLREKITSRKMAGDITTEQAASLTVALDSRLTQLEAVA
jgi:hypothetical protein